MTKTKRSKCPIFYDVKLFLINGDSVQNLTVEKNVLLLFNWLKQTVILFLSTSKYPSFHKKYLFWVITPGKIINSNSVDATAQLNHQSVEQFSKYYFNLLPSEHSL